MSDTQLTHSQKLNSKTTKFSKKYEDENQQLFITRLCKFQFGIIMSHVALWEDPHSSSAAL